MKKLACFLTCAAFFTLAAAHAEDRVVATVNGQPIPESRVKEQEDQIPADLLQGREAEVKRQLIDRVIDQVLVEQEGNTLNIEADPEYRKQLALVRMQLIANAVVALRVKEGITDEALKKLYNSTKESLAFPAVKAKHILVPTEQEAREIIKIVNPRNFSEVAKARSKGPSAEQGGDLGWFRKEAMIPEFAEIAFKTTPGTVSPTPISTQFGWHVLFIENRSDKFIPPLDQVEPQLRQELAQKITSEYLGNLRRGAKIVYRAPYDK